MCVCVCVCVCACVRARTRPWARLGSAIVGSGGLVLRACPCVYVRVCVRMHVHALVNVRLGVCAGVRVCGCAGVRARSCAGVRLRGCAGGRVQLVRVFVCSVCLPACLSPCVSVCLAACLPVRPSVRLRLVCACFVSVCVCVLSLCVCTLLHHTFPSIAQFLCIALIPRQYLTGAVMMTSDAGIIPEMLPVKVTCAVAACARSA